MSNQIYRGYDITAKADGQWTVTKDGKELYAAASEDAAMNWIDAQRRRMASK